MNIVHIVPAARIGGVLRQIRELSDLLPASYHSRAVSIFDLDDRFGLELLQDRLSCLRIPISECRDEKTISRLLLETVYSFRPDVLHSHHLFTDYFTVRAAKEIGLPVVQTVHGITQASWEEPISRDEVRVDWSRFDIEKQLQIQGSINNTDTVSLELRQRLVGYGLDSGRINVVYPGVRPENEVPSWAATEERRASRLRFRIGFLHRLEPVKNPLVLPRLALTLRRLGLATYFMLPDLGRMAAHVKEQARVFGVQNCFEFIEPGNDVWAGVSDLDVLLICSFSEGVPIVMLEAMARGIPIVSYNVGGVSEVVEHGHSGYLVEPDNIRQLARALAEIARSQPLQRTMGRCARETVVRRFSIMNNIQNREEIYERVAL